MFVLKEVFHRGKSVGNYGKIEQITFFTSSVFCWNLYNKLGSIISYWDIEFTLISISKKKICLLFARGSAITLKLAYKWFLPEDPNRMNQN